MNATGKPRRTPPREVLDRCHRDCEKARDACQRAAEIMHGQTGCWTVEFWQVPTEDGQIKLTWAGAPFGRVPREFQIGWWQAVMDCAWQEIVRLRG